MYQSSVWEHYAVFNRQPSGEQWDAYLVDLDTGEVQQIGSSSSNQDEAKIQGGRVIWTDYRGSGPHLGMHIFIYSLRTRREYVLNPSGRAGSGPMIFDRYVVWDGLTEEGVEGIWATRIGDI